MLSWPALSPRSYISHLHLQQNIHGDSNELLKFHAPPALRPSTHTHRHAHSYTSSEQEIWTLLSTCGVKNTINLESFFQLRLGRNNRIMKNTILGQVTYGWSKFPYGISWMKSEGWGCVWPPTVPSNQVVRAVCTNECSFDPPV